MEELAPHYPEEWSDDDVTLLESPIEGEHRILRLTRRNTHVYRFYFNKEYDYIVHAFGEGENDYVVYFLDFDEELDRLLSERDYPEIPLAQVNAGVMEHKEKQNNIALFSRTFSEINSPEDLFNAIARDEEQAA
jgi:hypothetical protein